MRISRYSFVLLFILTVSPASGQFPPDFIWGAATAAQQIEGGWIKDGRAPSIWDNLARIPGYVADGATPDVGPNSYDHYMEDVQILKDHGIKHYRLSISWPRIIPQGRNGTYVNQKGIAYYRNLIKALLDAGITPYVTLYHWDLPIELALRGHGIDSKYFVTDFLYFAETCFKEFGDLVKNWFTFNEIWCMAILNNFKKRDVGTKPYMIAHNSLRAHAYTVNLYRTKYNKDGKGKIGIVVNSSMMYPKNKDKKSDVEAAERGLDYSLGWITNPVFKGEYPEIMRKRTGNRLPEFTPEEKALLINSTDFIGINHYFSELCETDNHEKGTEYWSDRNVRTSNDPSWNYTHSKWPIVPQGLKHIILYIHNKWTKNTNISIWITENGMSADEQNITAAVNDKARIKYHKDYIEAMGEAIKEGANVKAYFVWSLLDNFEWWSGYSIRFGMVRVEYTEPPQRIPKISLRWYRDFIKKVTTVKADK